MQTNPRLANSRALGRANCSAVPPKPWLIRIAGNGPAPSGFTRMPADRLLPFADGELLPVDLQASRRIGGQRRQGEHRLGKRPRYEYRQPHRLQSNHVGSPTVRT